ncbi:hypothetical protein BCR15_03380 [Tessaracoccus lapidicaptus]|jgi:hypothetical protein|uniref:Uncharacterized protein n=1 Tax=Tessaracoccus lapidicaptus TaxID=1427523 RepID=A0A1C0AN74_9ACTN|nr:MULTISPECIES: hypothetical protein [Tessaracoccus]AQX14605.1 hypothetical protein BKM78_00635 [Tessaracoccus sp. T2.5-30]OCL34737.1 hypothetical protein BCR15_03380 [Tessaracoccus lapidicaptus]VEP38652.1 hypothetical protein TLA_TLA_00129 [Tessaracoccus lapidicaptus]
MSEHRIPGQNADAAVEDSELTPRETEQPEAGEHLHTSDHSIAEEDIEADRRHQASDPRTTS